MFYVTENSRFLIDICVEAPYDVVEKFDNRVSVKGNELDDGNGIIANRDVGVGVSFRTDEREVDFRQRRRMSR